MINEIKKISAGRFLINEDVIVYDLNIEDGEIVYSLDFDGKKISELQALELCNEFINQALNSPTEKVI
jgi:ABC-type xylose transport system substrate-binding protein